MGFWSTLGKGLAIGGSAIAAPFTGGTSLSALPAILGGAGAAIGGMGAAATKNRGEQDVMNLNRDQLRLRENEGFDRALMDRAALEIKQREEARAAQKAAFNDALRSALAKNMQDVSVDRSAFRTNVPTISFAGGARPSAIGPEGREAAGVMNSQALQALMSPQALSAVAPPSRVQMSEPSKASFWEKLAGPLGMGLSIAGMGLDASNRPQAAPPVQSSIGINPNDILFRG